MILKVLSKWGIEFPNLENGSLSNSRLEELARLLRWWILCPICQARIFKNMYFEPPYNGTYTVVDVPTIIPTMHSV